MRLGTTTSYPARGNDKQKKFYHHHKYNRNELCQLNSQWQPRSGRYHSVISREAQRCIDVIATPILPTLGLCGSANAYACAVKVG